MPTAALAHERTFAQALQRHQRRLQPKLHGQPRGGSVHDFVRLVARTVDRLNSQARLNAQDAAAVRAGILHEALLPLLYIRGGRIGDAAGVLAETWEALARRESRRKARGHRLAPVDALGEDVALLVALFNSAVTEEMLASATDNRGRLTIGRLMTTLRLSYDDIGRMFSVSGETARRWALGVSSIPADAAARLDVANQAINRMQRLIRPDRLPGVLRRQADAFDGDPALAWILRGRIADVAERYERDLAYQS